MSKDLSAIRQIRLGDELRALRLENNKTLIDVTSGLDGWSPARLSKMERADQPVGPNDLATLMDYYGVTGADRDYFENLLGSGPPKQWWRSLDYAEAITCGLRGVSRSRSRRFTHAELLPLRVPRTRPD